MPKQFLECGKIVTTHAIKGEVKVQPWCDEPAFLTAFERFYLDRDGARAIEVKSARVSGNTAIVKLDGIDTVEDAVKLRGKVLYINRDDTSLQPGEYFVQDLIGLDVFDADDQGIHYGRITDVSKTGANDVYHIEKDAKTVLIPAIKSVVISTDIDGGRMLIRPLKGLFDDED